MSVGDWRRENVNMFIKELHEAIQSIKPWVKFGVSPFGIYRNKRNDPNGSNTNGLQNYDDLYADVLKWVDKGWIDYCVPQIYWEMGNKAADYTTLINWWNRNVTKRPLFIGEDIERTAKYTDPQNPAQNQLPAKMRLHKQSRNVSGTVLWYAKAAVDNTGNYGQMLRNVYWKYPALQPRMTFIESKAPKKVRKMKIMNISGDQVLCWTKPGGKGWKKEAVKYVVYRFNPGEPINLDDEKHILGITYNNFFKLNSRGVYVVTALDRMSNEGTGVKVNY